jgi:hypothetical protein
MAALNRFGLPSERANNPFDPFSDGITPLFVFNANLAGEMLSSTAMCAKRFYKARSTSGGFTGQAYGLATGARYGKSFNQAQLLRSYQMFFDDAAVSSKNTFMLPRLGCNKNSQINEEVVRDIAISNSPANVMLPGVWERKRHNDEICRLFFYGHSYLADDEVFAALDYLTSKIQREVPAENIEIIIPPREDAAKRAVAYALSRGFSHRIVMPLQKGVRNNDVLASHFVFWYATHCILLYSKSPLFDNFHSIDRYGNLAKFSDIAMRHRLGTRWTNIEDIRPFL